MSTHDRDHLLSQHKEELRIQQQVAFASGLFQGDLTIRTILESLAEGVVVVDSSGTILLVNARAEQMFGYQEKVLIGQPHAVLIPERFRMDHEMHEAHFFSKPTIRQMGQLLELTGRRQDGSEFPLEISLSFIETINGVLVMALISDISLRKQAEQAIIESEALYRGIGESIDYGIWICAPDGRNIYASESFLSMLGITQEQFSDFGWKDVLHPDDTERTIKKWQECVLTGCTWNDEQRYRCKDGQWHYVLVRGVPIRNKRGEITKWAGINLDISHLKRIEDQLKISIAEKDAMMREIHHRVKNNLQVISSLVSLQAENLTDERIREEFNEVRDRVRSMSLIHEKLYQTDNFAQLNFADYATSLLHHLWHSHGALTTKIGLKLQLAPVMLPIEAAVPCGLILNELIINSLKHAFPNNSSGEVTVNLVYDPATDAICLRVHDNGVGLPVGMDWRRAKSLGLRLVQILVKQLHGTVETGTDPGAEFRINFFLNKFNS